VAESHWHLERNTHDFTVHVIAFASSFPPPRRACCGNMASTFRPSESQRHSYGQSAPGNAGFSVAGMPPMGSSQLSSSTWGASAPGASFGGSLSDSLSQSRPHYTSGYLMVRSGCLSATYDALTIRRHSRPLRARYGHCGTLSTTRHTLTYSIDFTRHRSS
jgi:hypothetical protein